MTLAAIAAPRLAAGQVGAPFPSRPIELWLPWPAGGATDLTMRVLAEGAGQGLGQKVIVENRGGAGGTLVMPVLQQALPDGYVIAQMPQPVFRAVWTQKVLWDPIRDTTPIIQISGVTFGIVVPAASPLRSLDDLFAWARAHPGELTVATNGVGTTPHLVLDELFGRRGLSYVHVPYKGTAEQMIAVASGQLMAGVNSNGFAPFVDGGQLRLLVTFGEHRTRRWPQVPTLKELGHGIVAMSPYGLAGPRGLPAPVVQVLHNAFKAAAFAPAHVAELARYDQELSYLGPEDYGRAMREAYAAEKRTAERLGLARTPS
ncbi:MAG: tripartite tricarboxylate transporter substrate binding protein [Rubrivivax sp.]